MVKKPRYFIERYRSQFNVCLRTQKSFWVICTTNSHWNAIRVKSGLDNLDRWQGFLYSDLYFRAWKTQIGRDLIKQMRKLVRINIKPGQRIQPFIKPEPKPPVKLTQAQRAAYLMVRYEDAKKAFAPGAYNSQFTKDFVESLRIYFNYSQKTYWLDIYGKFKSAWQAELKGREKEIEEEWNRLKKRVNIRG